MMFNLTHSLPDQCFMACSGGVDSISILHFLTYGANKSRVRGVIYINHNTGTFADDSETLVTRFCSSKNLPLTIHKVVGSPPAGRSKEDWWREQRYNAFECMHPNISIVLGHQFNDCLEEYLMCVLVRGFQGTIPYAHGRCIRPFRLWKREDIESYAAKHELEYMKDPSNEDTKYKRNFIRKELLPKALVLNPGLYNIVRRLIEGM